MPTCIHILKNAQPECSGIARIVADFAKRSESRGYRTVVLFLGDGPLASEMTQAGVEATSVSWTGYRNDLTGMWRVWRWLGSHPAEIAHLHHGARTHRMLCRMAGVSAVVQHVHGQILEPALNPISDLRFDGTDAVIACSKAVAECLRGCNPEVIYSGIEIATRPAAFPLTGPLRLGVLSRLIPLKNLEAILEISARLKEAGIDFQMEIAGIGPSESALRELAAKLDIVEQVRFLGWQSDVSSLLASWQILLLPSLQEGLPRAALEAMAAARPVFASRVGGLDELVVDGISGRLFKPGAVEEMACSIAEADKDRRRLAEMGWEGRERARALFSPDHMADRVVALYDRLLRRGR